MSTEILIEFKKQLISFFDELIDQFPNESDFIVIRIFIKDQIPIKTIMDTFIYHMNKNDHEFKKMVKQRNDSFFLDHNIFDAFGKSNVNNIKKLWLSGEIDDDTKTVIWQWVDIFIILSERYAKCSNNNV